MSNMKTTPRKLAILSVLISSVLLSETAAAADIIVVDEKGSPTGTKVSASTGADQNVYTKDAVDTKLDKKVNAADVYTRTDVYTKTEANTELDKKANAADVYTRTEANTELDKKANAADVYTQTQTDEKIGRVRTDLEGTLKDDVKKNVEQSVVKDVKTELNSKLFDMQGKLGSDLKTESENRLSGDIKTLKSANDYTDQQFNKLQSYTDQKVNYLDNKIDRIEKRANAGVASVAAMSNIPYSNNTGFSLGLGLGQYRNGSAVALGIQDKLNENVSLRLSTSWNNSGSPVFGAGVGISW
ncbi:YadA-like family protein [Xenorhabdus budapestensis]|uniref:Adhesin n=1 Tax=Xenorhabdus budapestensis TaxID=290110 RepID=A0A2D0IW50_XENBU|nr:YadA-like family protein [Xenorhabdus budapestensis]PHM26116.1 adhesin [Xenorhabdus budapestensis]